MSARPSAAVKIVRPKTVGGDSTVTLDSPKKKDTQRQCRNVMIHGFCKYEGRGCAYQHPPRAQSAEPDSLESTLNTSINVNAPVFVPKSTPTPSTNEEKRQLPPEFTPSGSFSQLSLTNGDTAANDYGFSAPLQAGIGSEYVDYSPVMSQLPIDMPMPSDPYYAAGGPAVPYPYNRQPLDYHLYVPVKDTIHPAARHLMSPTLHEELTRRSEAMHYSPPAVKYQSEIPEEVSGYHSLVPVEGRDTHIGNWKSTLWRAIKAETGDIYLLKRIENFRLPHEQAFRTISTWKRVKSPNVIALHEAFTTRAWGDSSLVLVYEYHPIARTIAEVHVHGPQLPNSYYGKRNYNNSSSMQHGGGIEERVLWSYLIQLACGIKAVHDVGLAVRSLSIGDGAEVWITGKNRARIGAVGLWDVLAYDPTRQMNPQQEVAFLQQEDLLQFGKLIITLASPSQHAGHPNPNSVPINKLLDAIGRSYSADMKNVVLWCISKPSPHKVIAQLFDMIGSRLLGEMDAMQVRGDSLEHMLMSELENARLVRLMCKFGFINERPEFDHESRWSETGDRYIIKLFRDYVFHQVDEEGRPVLDLGHVLSCLNKLDASSEERVMLVSRDEQSCLVVSYKDIKTCLDGAFRDLARPR